ncbi:hypothetical protein CUMW_267180 [Citrus unshiu]|uniref:non-specific serine/threonine protein kinase n=1 Tax=Citrus unshiu TaxID=55188 RepID=A0A2H5QW49_CITUN|nr:hypothetical protein CUMW_267180 [Citrus unshiu]
MNAIPKPEVIELIKRGRARHALPPTVPRSSGRDVPDGDTSLESPSPFSLKVSSEPEDPSSPLLPLVEVVWGDILLALVPTLNLMGSKGIPGSKAGSVSRPAIAITLALKSKLIECRKGSTVLSNDSILSSQATLRRFSYLELLRATNNFSENNIIGIGGFGSVYGGRLEDGMKIAIKVFHQQCASSLKSFEAECEVLKNIRHQNLIKVISSCSNDDFKALVLEYMSNGSLGDWLHSSNYMFNIFQRLNIMIDVASSLEYLHFDHSTAIIHCDLKPSNVLLDENMVAHLSDFGIAKLLRGEDESMMRTKTLATIGYMAPEYGIEGEVSTKSDVYSYGIMLMETFTKKKPTDEIFVGELSLKRWVNDLLPNSFVEVVDKTLLSGEEKLSTAKDQCLLSIFILALECTMESPEKRINAKDIVTGLLKIRDTLSKRIGNLSRIVIWLHFKKSNYTKEYDLIY